MRSSLGCTMHLNRAVIFCFVAAIALIDNRQMQYYGGLPLAISACVAAETKLPESVSDEFKQLEKLFQEYYPQAKLVRTSTGLRTEYKLAKVDAPGPGAHLAPSAGGILCQVDCKPGKSAEKPSNTIEKSHSTLILAPYSSFFKSHLSAKLVYPADCSADFRKRFTGLIEGFSALQDTSVSVENAGQSEPHAKAAHAHEDRLSDVASKPLPPDLPGVLPEDASLVGTREQATAPSPTDAKSAGDAKETKDAKQTDATDIASLPPPHHSRFESKYDNPSASPPLIFNMEEFPTTLPEVIVGPMKLSVSKNIKMEEKSQEKPASGQTVDDPTKNMAENTAFKSAAAALSKGQYKVALRMFESLAAKHPKDPRYFYGAGMAYRMLGNNRDAFPYFVIALHLDQMQPEYGIAAQDSVRALQSEIDDQLNLGYGVQSPSMLLHTGVQCWRLGLTKASTQLFAYVLRNEPLYAGVAAFDLGATAEHNGQFKLALQYYDWALRSNLRLESARAQNPFYSGQIQQALSSLPSQKIEQARAEVMYKLRGVAWSWNGWDQATSYPARGMSEICFTCTINRTSKVGE